VRIRSKRKWKRVKRWRSKIKSLLIIRRIKSKERIMKGKYLLMNLLVLYKI